MPKIHPKPSVFCDLALYRPEQVRRILCHIEDCAACQSQLARLPSGGPEDAEGPSGAASEVYGNLVDNIMGKLRPHILAVERERTEAPALLAELRRHPHERRVLLVRNSARFRGFGLCRLLLRTSLEVSPRDSREGEHWATLALMVADLLDPAASGPRLIEDARARCWTAIGNARRIASDLHGADAAFQVADLHLRRGTGDRLEREQVLRRKASLRRAQRRLGEAVSYARRAASISLASGEADRAARALVVWAMTSQEAGDVEGALHLLRAAERLAGGLPASDPLLDLSIRHNRVASLVEAGRLPQARLLLARSQDFYDDYPEARYQLRRCWVEGRIAMSLNGWDDALRRLTPVRDGFLEIGGHYDAALVSLDLAWIQMRRGCLATAGRLARQVLPAFEAWGVEREALATRLLLKHLR